MYTVQNIGILDNTQVYTLNEPLPGGLQRILWGEPMYHAEWERDEHSKLWGVRFGPEIPVGSIGFKDVGVETVRPLDDALEGYIELHRSGINPEHRRQGKDRMFLTFLEEWVQKEGFIGIAALEPTRPTYFVDEGYDMYSDFLKRNWAIKPGFRDDEEPEIYDRFEGEEDIRFLSEQY